MTEPAVFPVPVASDSRGPFARLLSRCLLLLLLVGAATPARAQEVGEIAVSDTLYEVRMAGGETFLGRVVAVQGDTVTLQTIGGVRVQLHRPQITSIRAARGRIVRGEFWREDPNRTRLFFSPTARGLPRGSGYFGVYELFIPFVAYGVTDRVLLAGGSPFYLAFTGEVTPPFYFGPKVQVLDSPKFDGAVGAMVLVVPEWNDEDEGGSAGIVYGVGTYGGPDDAVTAGLGWGFIEDEISSKPAVMLGGETRVGRSIKLVTENLFVPGEDGLVLSGGIRFFGERLSADAGLIGLFANGGLDCCLPLVNFVYSFGGR